MSDSQLRQIIEALGDRLTAAGYTVRRGGQIDSHKDELPIVGMYVSQGGIQLEDDEQPWWVMERVTISVEIYRHIPGPDPLLQAADDRRDLMQVLWSTDTERPDTLGGLVEAPGIRLAGSDIFFDDPHSQVVVTQVRLELHFSED